MSRLKNKEFKDYDYTSRYVSVPYYYDTVNGRYVCQVASQLSDKTVYTVHKVKQGDTPDKLALKYYNNPTYYWIICAFNRIKNPYKELIVGSDIKIPAMSTLKYDHNGRF